ncbi:MAG: DUF167 domain-containing protein [Anaerolineales bacterium]|nr:DUF167 domain-containing protein [Anaerolineales bacterium]
MIGRKFNFHDGEKGSALAVRIAIGKEKQKIAKILDDGTVVVNLSGKTKNLNQELIKFLSKELNIAQRKFDIIAGAESKEKLISVLDVGSEEIQELVLSNLT